MLLSIRFIIKILGVERFIINTNRIDKAIIIAKQLESDLELRKKKLEGLNSIIGTKIDQNYLTFYNSIKQKALTIKTKKHEVKSVVDIDEDTLLIFVLMNENNLESTSLVTTRVTNNVILRFFKVTKYPSENKVIIRSTFSNDSFEKLTLSRFYDDLEKL